MMEEDEKDAMEFVVKLIAMFVVGWLLVVGLIKLTQWAF